MCHTVQFRETNYLDQWTFWPHNLVKIPNQFYIFDLLYSNSLFIVLVLLYPVYISFQAFRLDCCFETLYFGSKTSNCKWYVNIKRKCYCNSIWKHALNCCWWFTLGVNILCSVFAVTVIITVFCRINICF